MATQLKQIVELLNAEPFHSDLSLVAFDEKEGVDLLEILKRVLAHLDASGKFDADLREDSPEATCQKFTEYLHLLGYQCSYDMEFQQALMMGEKKVVNAILWWLLTNLESLKKRSFLAHFCVNFEVPEEILRDEPVFELYQGYKELQSQFKTTHAHLEQLRLQKQHPGDLQKEVQQLAAESEQLTQKIASFRQRSANTPGFQNLLQITSLLRKEQEEEARLTERLVEQKMGLEQTEHLFLEKSRRVHELRQAQASEPANSAEAMLKVVRIETQRNKDAEARLLRERDEKLRKMQLVEIALQEPAVTQNMVMEIQTECAHMEQQCEHLDAQLESQNATDSKLTVYKQQANLVAKKKEMTQTELQKHLEERDALASQIAQKEKEYEAKQGHKFMKRDDFKAYAGSLREKSNQFKKQKDELNAWRGEVAVLIRTLQMVNAQHPLPAEVRDNEKAIEKTSMAKAQEDSAKAQSMDELSELVKQITTQLREQKNKLAPQIKELRTVRQQFAQVEQRYLELKSKYDEARLAVDADLNRVNGDVTTMQDEVNSLERKYHELQTQLTWSETRLNKVHKEAKQLRDAPHQSLTTQYNNSLTKMEQQARELRQRQKHVKETHEERVKQKQIFSQLEALMDIKLKVTSNYEAGGTNLYAAQSVEYGMRPAIDMSHGAVNRIVIGD
ncbi:unnamed protein product [Amoebophrya sp. A25]|nr:unnamed protein product [Amoebophrya sp. A25]|eukprot:GSA25T00012329001.1